MDSKIREMNWIKFNINKIPENKKVLVKFNNDKEIIGKRNGHWMIYPPNVDFDTFISKEKQFKIL